MTSFSVHGLLVVQLPYIWRDEVWVSWPKAWDIILSIVVVSVFCNILLIFLVPPNNAGVSKSLQWEIWIISLKHKISSYSSFDKTVEEENFHWPRNSSIWAWPWSEEMGPMAAVWSIKCEPWFWADIKFSSALSITWRWTQEIEKFYNMVLSYLTRPPLLMCFVEFSASSLLVFWE